MTDIRERATRIVNFLNSRGVGFAKGHDELAQPVSAVQVCRQFVPALKEVNPKSLSALRNLRAALLAIQEPKSATSAREALDNFASASLFRLSFADPKRTSWAQNTGDPVSGAILMDAAEVLNAGHWDRIKTCCNTACASAFYDESRSKTQRWHSYAVCGNKSNVAAFRSRQA